MLRLEVRTAQGFNQETNEFVSLESFALELEHSLVSLSKWESKFKKPFLSPGTKSDEELRDYVRLMTLTPNVPEEIYRKLSEGNISSIDEYINDTMTATWFREKPAAESRRPVTAELIYYWMIALGVPFECQHWHLNKLFTLIRVCSDQQKPPEKLSNAELAQRNRAENARRRAELGSSG
jgi:hypothetical protein